MKLLTKEIERKLKPFGTYGNKERTEEDQDKEPFFDVPIVLKLFTPDSSWTWFVAEAMAITADCEEKPLAEVPENERADVMLWGAVKGFELEWGYTSLNELMAIRGPYGLPIERDMWWTPRKWADVPSYERR